MRSEGKRVGRERKNPERWSVQLSHKQQNASFIQLIENTTAVRDQLPLHITLRYIYFYKETS